MTSDSTSLPSILLSSLKGKALQGALALRLDYGMMEEWERGPIPGWYPSMLPWVHPPVRPLVLTSPLHLRVRVRELNGAMGSKRGVRNSQMTLLEVLSETIWLLALILVPCCKNHLCPKAPEYLGLSIPPGILSRPRTLP